MVVWRCIIMERIQSPEKPVSQSTPCIVASSTTWTQWRHVVQVTRVDTGHCVKQVTWQLLMVNMDLSLLS